jgi:predicted naringenin-chalcone synthase
VITDCVRQVLQKTNTKASAIDVLIINCSLFSPTPSLCAMVINEFDMRSDILSYNLSGMVSKWLKGGKEGDDRALSMPCHAMPRPT